MINRRGNTKNAGKPPNSMGSACASSRLCGGILIMEANKTAEFAGLGHRMVAVVIDTAIILGAETALLFTCFSAEALEEMGEDVSRGLFIIFMMLLSIVYFTLIEGTFGHTIGKRVANIKVVKADGGEITYSKALIRNILRFIDIIGPAPYILGMIMIMITKNKQRLGDIAAGTIVVKKEIKNCLGGKHD